MMESSMIRDEAAVTAAIVRLERVQYGRDEHHLNSTVLLMREYLRRSALWALALECADWGPFFDIARRLTLRTGDDGALPGSVLLDPEPVYGGVGADPLEDRIIALRQHLRRPGQAVSTLMEKCLLWHLRWEMIAADTATTAFGLSAPYEPLVVLYERGGWFQTRHGEIEFYPVGTLRAGDAVRRAVPEPVVSLDTGTLDQIDAGPN